MKKSTLSLVIASAFAFSVNFAHATNIGATAPATLSPTVSQHSNPTIDEVATDIGTLNREKLSIADFNQAISGVASASANAAGSAGNAAHLAQTTATGAQATAQVAQVTALTAQSTAVGAQTTANGNGQALQAFQDQTNSHFANLDKRVNDNRRRASAAISGVAAMANIPQVSQGARFSLGAGVGTTDNQSALAVGFSSRIAEPVVVKASLSADSQHNLVAGAGASVEW